jgi:peroxiredoxin
MQNDRPLKIGDAAPDFSLPGVDGHTYSLASFSAKPALIIVFSCNHCPYVQAYEDRLVAFQRDYADRGAQIVAINSNDDRNYPEDSFENMVKRASQKGFNFPYLRDASQTVARAYRASHTPQLFVFERARRLAYTGKIDDNWQQPHAAKTHYLRDAVDALLRGSAAPVPTTHAIGCTIKWAH